MKHGIIRVETIPRSGTYFINNLLRAYTGKDWCGYHNRAPFHPHCYIDGKGIKLEEIISQISSCTNEAFSFPIVNGRSLERVVFIYRNPLDQAVSFYDHVYSNFSHFKKQSSHIRFFGRCKTPTELALAYVRTYSCLYTSHFNFKKTNPERMMIFSYEEMMRDVPKIMGKIIKFLIGELDESKLKQSLKQCSIAELQAKEIKNNRTLANDLLYKKGMSHILDGKIGKWRERIDMSLLDEIKKRYSEFGINIMEFDGIKEFELRYWMQLCEKFNYISIDDTKIENYNYNK